MATTHEWTLMIDSLTGEWMVNDGLCQMVKAGTVGDRVGVITKMAQSGCLGTNQHCFRRTGSRVYYASETGCWPAKSLPKKFWLCSTNLKETTIPEVGEEACSSGEEAGEGEVSPEGSFRGSLRGSPSHRSQDSGYSDSGESTNAHNDSDSLLNTPPNVKHITRVYFGENPHLFNDKIVVVPQIKIITPPSEDNPNDNIHHHIIGQPQGQPQGYDTGTGYEEVAEELEHKSVLEAATPTTITTTTTRRGGGSMRTQRLSNHNNNTNNNNSVCLGVPCRIQRRSSSAEKLLADALSEQHRRASCRARRRWSLGEEHTLHLKPCKQHQYQHHGGGGGGGGGRMGGGVVSQVSCGTNTHISCVTNTHVTSCPTEKNSTTTNTHNCDTNTRGISSYSPDKSSSQFHQHRGVDAWFLECLNDPIDNFPSSISSCSTRERKVNVMTSTPHTSQRQTKEQPFTVAKKMRNASLQQWVRELRVLYEAECMNTLQSKSLPGDPARRHTSVPPSARHAVRAIQRRAHAVSTEFARLCQRLEWLDLGEVPPLAESLVEHINTFLRDYTTQWTAAHPDLQPQSSLSRQSKVIRQICERLREVCQSKKEEEEEERKEKEENNESQHKTRQVVQVVTALGHAFTKLVDLMLSREIRVMVRALEMPGSRDEVQSMVSQLTALGVDGGHICRLIARLGGVRGLLGVCVEPTLRQYRGDTLRALATVCCVVEGIADLDKAGGVEVVAEAGGVEVVAEVLCDEQCCEEERSEAAGVLAQITSPWVENTHRLPALTDHMSPIVHALTELARDTQTPEIFLLASAALANLTFLDGGSVEAMRTAGTSRVLLKAARDSPNISIFTKDQIATVLANLAGSQEAAEEVVEEDGVSVLLSLLNTRPAPTHRLPEVATAERVQQKSAIALSRLCRDSSVARQVAKLGGAERLVRLCKDEHERNHSDAVLVACLAALRKMASSLGSEELRGMDATELVEPRLLDSFLIYSSRQESFV
ncbi:hypothetical protein Pcinc_029764 [Petrolisthes cinctipes]|uniref:Protein inscuteable homologue C-terminal domain-containing protein n=1 Tax=Petrolisthes cinctipes TaxID=88211 RepID=A0AAE1F088_PETCI|nr:hypothetical protein Pcinc_029764 [Petrolisthes cinctipes]